jgi:hypothetical protein
MCTSQLIAVAILAKVQVEELVVTSHIDLPALIQSLATQTKMKKVCVGNILDFGAFLAYLPLSVQIFNFYSDQDKEQLLALLLNCT